VTDPACFTLHSTTPVLRVIDGRALTVRNVVYHRDRPGVAQARITRHDHNAAGQLIASIDPRLYAAQAERAGVAANLVQRRSLSGRFLHSCNVDSGTVVTLHDACSRVAVTWLANGVEQSRRYETAPLPGRLVSVSERVAAQNRRTAERWLWAGDVAWAKDRNLAGHCHTRFDSAGRNSVEARNLLGSIASESLQLLAGHEESDWAGDDPQAWAARLEPQSLNSSVIVDACGSILASQDAMGHRQRRAYDRCGQYRAGWIAREGSVERPVVLDVTYDAGGHKHVERHANGIVTTHTYAADSQRLASLTTTRLHDRQTLQDLHYQYDPAGLVIQVRNNAEQTRFWRNQKIEPQQDYRYDSLSQLIMASGRQMAALGRVGSDLPQACPLDANAYTLYHRFYDYDQASNLQGIRHTVPATNTGYTVRLTLSERSNRAVASSLCDDPAQVDSHFDAAGQQRALDTAHRAVWSSRMQLASVERAGAGTERYLYGAQHQRLRKTYAQGTTHYLPGLEWQQSGAHAMHSIEVAEHTRLLYWPGGSPAGVANDQLRYSYADLLGSHGLEVDGEGQVISREEFFPFGATAVWACRNQLEASYKTVRYSGKERDNTGLYYYGYRYYQPWLGRWLSADPAGTVDGLNLYSMVRNSPLSAIDDDGRMLRAAVKGGIGAAGIGYEVYKHKKDQSTPPQAPIASTNTSMGDRRADKAIGKVQRMKDDFSPGQQILNSTKGRGAAADHLAHGQVPGAKSVIKGAETLGTLVEFSQTGSLSQIAKAPLAGAVATDAANGVVQGIKTTIETTRKTVQGTAELATLSDAKANELQASMHVLEALAQDKLITGLSFGTTVKAGLDGAAAVVPHPVAKFGFKMLSAAWTVTGVVHGAEELGKIAEAHQDMLESKTGTNLMGQMKDINTSNRPGIVNQVKQMYGVSANP
jgi:insecticidal toxin complex protein TccC